MAQARADYQPVLCGPVHGNRVLELMRVFYCAGVITFGLYITHKTTRAQLASNYFSIFLSYYSSVLVGNICSG